MMGAGRSIERRREPFQRVVTSDGKHQKGRAMDPVMFYHLGQIRQREILQEAENQRRWRVPQAKTSLWERLRARLNVSLVRQEQPQVNTTVLARSR